jgi:hypothetical protein
MADKDMKYYRLADDIDFPDRWHLDGENFDSWVFEPRQLAERGIPSNLEVEAYLSGEPMDFTLSAVQGLPIVSTRMRKALGNPQGVRFFDVEVRGDSRKERHSIMVVDATVDCVDESLSEFEMYDADDPVYDYRTDEYEIFHKLVLDKAKANASGLGMFRLARCDLEIIVNGDVKRAIEEAGVTGTVFDEV